MTLINEKKEPLLASSNGFVTEKKKLDIDFRALGIVVVIAVIWLLFNFFSDGLFLSGRNLSNLLVQSSVLAILAVGLTKLLIGGQIDLSIGSSVALTGLVAATMNVNLGFSPAISILIAMAVGALLGLIQGSIVAFLAVPSFIVTLGGMLAFRGIGFLISDNKTIAPLSTGFTDISNGFIPSFTSLVLLTLIAVVSLVYILKKRRKTESGLATFIKLIPVITVFGILVWVSLTYNGLPFPVLIAGGIAFVGAVVLSSTKLGRKLYVIGGNAEAARYAGLSQIKVTITIFVILGVLYGAAGSLDVARLGGAPPGMNSGLELSVIAACVIGGTSLFGGRGTIMGSILGVLLFQSLSNGMDLLSIDSNIQYIVQGAILVTAVAIDQKFRSKK